MTPTGDQESGPRTWRERIVHWFVGAVSYGLGPLATDISEQSKPVGEPIQPQSLQLPKEDWVVEMDVRYGDDEYAFVEENGELRLVRADND